MSKVLRSKMSKVLALLCVVVMLIPANVFGDSKVKQNGGDLLISLNVSDDSGKDLSNADITVFSYLENKEIFEGKLDGNGRVNVFYSESKDLINKAIGNNEHLDVQYLIVITKGDQVLTEGHTRTYEARTKLFNFFKSAGIKESIKSVDMKTQNIETIDSAKKINIYENGMIKNSAYDSNGLRPNIHKYKDLGARSIKFARVSMARDCTATVDLETSATMVIDGSAGSILKSTFTKSTAQSV